jgi:hypothetical protein
MSRTHHNPSPQSPCTISGVNLGRIAVAKSYDLRYGTIRLPLIVLLFKNHDLPGLIVDGLLEKQIKNKVCPMTKQQGKAIRFFYELRGQS